MCVNSISWRSVVVVAIFNKHSDENHRGGSGNEKDRDEDVQPAMSFMA